jgi:hypothetical protein
MIIGHSSGGQAESLRLTPKGQQWGPRSLWEVVMKENRPWKQAGRAEAMIRVALVLPSLQEALPKLLQNCEKGCGM